DDAVQLRREAAIRRAVRLQAFLDRPAIVAGVAVARPGELVADAAAPIVLSVKFIDDDILSDVSSRLQLRNLRRLDSAEPAGGDFVFTLEDAQNKLVARFAWTPKQPGADIVHSVAPFIAIAIAGFALLAALVLRHMRRTAAA